MYAAPESPAKGFDETSNKKRAKVQG